VSNSSTARWRQRAQKHVVHLDRLAAMMGLDSRDKLMPAISQMRMMNDVLTKENAKLRAQQD
jgi:hypothetical protein